MNNVILIGMRGSGKTSVAKILSAKLNLPIIETDQEIVKQEGMTIQQMVEKHGWDYFRQKETELLKGLKELKDKQYILSTGGGMILSQENRELLRDIGIVYYLFAYPETSAKRVQKLDADRPALTENLSLSEELKKIFKDREELYEETADHIIHTENITPDEVTATILAYYLIANE